MKSAIILGATGLTGGILLKILLDDNRYSKIKVFSRRSLGIIHPKLEEHILDLFQLETAKEDFMADEVYCCIGTTKAKTPDLAVYKEVDYGIPVKAAKLAKENDIDTFIVISAMGADSGSRIFYNRTKGEMERDVLKENIQNTFFLQPSLITGERKEKRSFENFGKQLMKVADHLLVGSLKKYRSIHPEMIAEAMVCVANNGFHKKVIESDEIKNIVAEGA